MINQEQVKVEGPIVSLGTVKAVAVNEIERILAEGRYGQPKGWAGDFLAKVSVKVANLVQPIRLRYETDYSDQSLIGGSERPKKVTIKDSDELIKAAEAFGVIIDWSDIFNAYLILVNQWSDGDKAAVQIVRASEYDASWVHNALLAFQAAAKKIEGMVVTISQTKEEYVKAEHTYRSSPRLDVTYGNETFHIENEKGLMAWSDGKRYRANKPETFLKHFKEIVEEKIHKADMEKKAKEASVNRFASLTERLKGYTVESNYGDGYRIKLAGQYNFLEFHYSESQPQYKHAEYFAIKGLPGLTFDEFMIILGVAVKAAQRKAQ